MCSSVTSKVLVNIGVSLRAPHQANRLAMNMIFPPGALLSKEVQFKTFCLAEKTKYSPTENVYNETPDDGIRKK